MEKKQGRDFREGIRIITRTSKNKNFIAEKETIKRLLICIIYYLFLEFATYKYIT